MSIIDHLLIGFIFGLVLSVSVGFYLYQRYRTYLTALQVTNDCINALATLNKLHANKTAEAIKLNEVLLDCSIISLGALLQASRRKTNRQSYLFHLRRAKEYRDHFPHKSETSGMDWQIAEILKLASEQ